MWDETSNHIASLDQAGPVVNDAGEALQGRSGRRLANELSEFVVEGQLQAAVHLGQEGRLLGA